VLLRHTYRGMNIMRFCFIGEAMIELANSANECRIGFAGDTLNTAVHLARYGHEVAYFTSVGMDEYSKDFLGFLKQEKIDTRFVSQDDKLHMGLYSIRTDENGERSFQYWRDNSAAKQMFRGANLRELSNSLAGFDYVCFSLISLAILANEPREFLLSLCQNLSKKGVKIAFDGNYRPKLWESKLIAEKYRDKAIAIADIGLPTFEDEVAISNFDSIDQCILHWQKNGAAEILVKDGANGCVTGNMEKILPNALLKPIDTSGAGDAFNAGYLSARANGCSPLQSAAKGNELAGWVIMNRGAIPPINNAAPY